MCHCAFNIKIIEVENKKQYFTTSGNNKFTKEILVAKIK